MTSQTINLDLIPQGVPPVIYVSQYDKGQTWLFNILKGGSAFAIPSVANITIQGTKSDSTGFQYGCSFDGSQVSATEEQQMTILAGDVPAEIVIASGGAIIGSLNFIIRVEPAALSADTEISETELPLIEEAAELAEQIPSIIAQIEGLEEDAEAWATGTRGGQPVPSTDPTYQNNSKYYAENCIGMITDAQWADIQNILV
jgi:hypothetical protein